MIEVDSIDSNWLYPLGTYAQALMLTGRIEDARPVARKLLGQSWNDEDFLAMCRKHGLIEVEVSE